MDNRVDVVPTAMVDALACQLYRDDQSAVGEEWLPWHELDGSDDAVSCRDMYRAAATRLLSAAFDCCDVTTQWAVGYPDPTGTAMFGGWWSNASVPTAMLGYPDDLPAGSHLVRRVVVTAVDGPVDNREPVRHNDLRVGVASDSTCDGVGSGLRPETVAATNVGVEVAACPDRGVITKGHSL